MTVAQSWNKEAYGSKKEYGIQLVHETDEQENS